MTCGCRFDEEGVGCKQIEGFQCQEETLPVIANAIVWQVVILVIIFVVDIIVSVVVIISSSSNRITCYYYHSYYCYFFINIILFAVVEYFVCLILLRKFYSCFLSFIFVLFLFSYVLLFTVDIVFVYNVLFYVSRFVQVSFYQDYIILTFFHSFVCLSVYSICC